MGEQCSAVENTKALATFGVSLGFKFPAFGINGS
jgi:hypothetical protein